MENGKLGQHSNKDIRMNLRTTYTVTVEDTIRILLSSLFLTVAMNNIFVLDKKIEEDKKVAKIEKEYTGKPLYCLQSEVTDNPYDKQISISVITTEVVNDVEYIQYTFGSYSKGDSLSNNRRGWFIDWNTIDCSKLD